MRVPGLTLQRFLYAATGMRKMCIRDRHMELAPADFAMSYIMRSGRIDIERLRKLSPSFVARYEQEQN